MMTTKELTDSEFDAYYGKYIYKLSDRTGLREGFEKGKQNVIQFFKSIPKDKLEYRYTPDKWSIKEVFQHLIDTERIFIYRCFRIARRDKTALAGYDQNSYSSPSGAHSKSIERLLEEFAITRQNSIAILNSLSDEDLKFIGNSNGGALSARSAAFTIIGHEIWHIEIIKERYL